MSDEVKSRASVDSGAFRELLWEFQHHPGSVAAINALIAHIDAWGARLAGDSPVVKRLITEIELLQKELRILCEKFGEMTTQIIELTSEVESLRGATPACDKGDA